MAGGACDRTVHDSEQTDASIAALAWLRERHEWRRPVYHLLSACARRSASRNRPSTSALCPALASSRPPPPRYIHLTRRGLDG
jgi:hypothetical protein